jgi:hypothetical protein
VILPAWDARQRRPRGRAGDDVERAFRQPDLCGNLGDTQKRKARVFAGYHARVARGERPTERPKICSGFKE